MIKMSATSSWLFLFCYLTASLASAFDLEDELGIFYFLFKP
jgi:hypothetical protein